MNIYHFKISRELLLQGEGDFFRKLNRFLGNFRIEGEDHYRNIIISFYSNEPIKEGWSNECFLVSKRNKRGSWYFTEINYLKNI